MKNKVTHEHCIGMRGNERPTETSNLFFTLSLYCKYKTTVAMGKERIEKKEKKKKKANTNVERERERERESHLWEHYEQNVLQLCGKLGGTANQQIF